MHFSHPTDVAGKQDIRIFQLPAKQLKSNPAALGA